MPGPPPKDPALRQRRNKKSTAATLSIVDNPKIPALPRAQRGRAWQSETKNWWVAIWGSPMVPQWDDSDRHGLLRILYLVDRYWVLVHMEPTIAGMRMEVSLLTEIRNQEKRYGLSPSDRASLHWQIELGDSAKAKTEKREQAARPKPTGVRADPRKLLG